MVETNPTKPAPAGTGATTRKLKRKKEKLEEGLESRVRSLQSTVHSRESDEGFDCGLKTVDCGLKSARCGLRCARVEKIAECRTTRGGIRENFLRASGCRKFCFSVSTLQHFHVLPHRTSTITARLNQHCRNNNNCDHETDDNNRTDYVQFCLVFVIAGRNSVQQMIERASFDVPSCHCNGD